MERKDLERVILKAIIFLVIAALIVMHFDLAIKGLIALIGFMSPMLLGFAIAFVINIILVRLEKIYFPKTTNRFLIKSRRPICITLSLFIILAAIAFVIAMVIPELIDAFTLLSKEIAQSYESILEKLADVVNHVPPFKTWLYENLEIDLNHPKDIDWENFFEKVVGLIVGTDGTGQFGSIMDSTVNIASSIGSGFVRFFIALIFGIYALASKEKLSRQVKQLVYAYIKPRTADRIYHVCGVASETFSNFIVGQCTEAVILGVLCIIGMSIFRFPHAVMIGTLIGATALIPIIGAYLGAIIGAIMVLTQGGVIQMLLFVLFIVVLQQIEGNLIYPKVVGTSVGLPGIWVLAAVTVGGSLNGVFGMLIGVPLAATIYRLLREDSQMRLIRRTEKKQKIPTGLINRYMPPKSSDSSDSSDSAGSGEVRTEAEYEEKASSPAASHPIDAINNAFEEILVTLQTNKENSSDSDASDSDNGAAD